MTITIEKKETTTQEVEIPIPSFWRNAGETSYVGLLDEKTVVEIISDEYEKTIRNFDNSRWSAGKDRVGIAHSMFHSCTETEFLDKYSEVEQSMSLHPKLAV